MSTKRFSQLTGIFFIVGAVSVNIPYFLLILNFDYPEILRAPIDQIMTKYQAGGNTLLVTWLAFAWVGIPMLFGALMLKRVLENENSLFLETATTIGVIGYIVQLIGLLRWVFVVPIIARLYVDPNSTSTLKESLSLLFMGIHQYGGVVMGEHIGQIFIIVWMSLISGIVYKSPLFAKWVSWLGWLASMVYLLAQTELLATVIPDIYQIGWAGMVGSILWLVWIIALGVYLIKNSDEVRIQKEN